MNAQAKPGEGEAWRRRSLAKAKASPGFDTKLTLLQRTLLYSTQETTWTNTGATRYGRGQHKTGSFGDDMLRPSPNHGTQRLPNDDDDDDPRNTAQLQS